MSDQLAAQLRGVADFIDQALADEHADRQAIAETASERIRYLAMVAAGEATFERRQPGTDLPPAVLAGNFDLTRDEVAVVLDALDVAADYKRDRTATCPDCDAAPADLCGTCEWRLAAADGYDALAARLRQERQS